jgi:chromosome segregation ATPase
MTPKEFAHATMLVSSLRNRLAHANALKDAAENERNELAAHVSAHVDALKQSNAQCAEYLRHNEMLAADRATLHRELVEVRAALAATTEQRDSLKRTLEEWSNADTTPHVRVAADDIADHVVPPVLPMCTTCHHCGNALDASVFGPYIMCTTIGCPRTVTNNDDGEDKSPYNGPCTSSHQVRHE